MADTATLSMTQDERATASRRATTTARVTARPIIGLLTPYCGGNLGDAAIYTSTIDAIRARVPDAEIFGLNLFPAETNRLHGVVAYPLNGYSLEKYRIFLGPALAPDGAALGNASNDAAPRDSWWSRAKVVSQRVPVVFTALRWVRDAAVNLRSEAAHLVRAFRIARRSSLIVVNGGGQLDDQFGGAWAHPYVLFKWAVVSWLTRTPFVVLSVGVCRISTPLSRLFLRVALSLARYRSYRDELSHSIVVSQLQAPADDDVVPDLAFGLNVDRGNRASANGSVTVAISPIAHFDPRWWEAGESGAYATYLRTMASFVVSLLGAGHSVRFYTTSRPDRQVLQDLVQCIPADARARLGGTPTPTYSLAEALDVIRESDLVVASRLHGVVLAHVMHRPTLAISYDTKVTTHMSDMGEQMYCIDINNCDFATLQDRFGTLLANRTATLQRLQAATGRGATLTSRQMDRILALAL